MKMQVLMSFQRWKCLSTLIKLLLLVTVYASQSLWILDENGMFNAEQKFLCHAVESYTACLFAYLETNQTKKDLEGGLSPYSISEGCIFRPEQLSMVQISFSKATDTSFNALRIHDIRGEELLENEYPAITSYSLQLPLQGKCNVALFKPTAQSSTFRNFASDLAIDGLKPQFTGHHICSHTDLTFAPWWRVDLLKCFLVYSVTLLAREDEFAKRLHDFEIRVGLYNETRLFENTLCGKQNRSMSIGESKDFVCTEGPLKGRFVVITMPKHSSCLELCEVEVWRAF